MAILRLEVWEKDLDRDDFVGQACIPVGEVKAGLRAVALKSQKGELLPSTLLCSIAKQS
jgi:phosphatidylinositol phospholipase C delta